MNKMERFCWLAKAKFFAAKERIKDYIGEVRREPGSHLVEVLGTIIVAIVILFLFRERIVDLFKNIMNSTDNKANALFENVTNVH